jgi:hypothetical protein
MLDHLIFKKVTIDKNKNKDQETNVEEEKEDEILDPYTYIRIKIKNY